MSSSPIALKDFDKESKDLLDKYSSEGGKWKVECKQKAEKGSFSVSPVSTNDGKMYIDVEGLMENGIGYKVNLTPEDLKGIKTTLSYEYMGQKLEGIVSRNGDQLQVEGTQAGLLPLSSLGLIYVNSKVNKDIAEVAATYSVSGILVGGGATVDVRNQKLKEWTAAAAAKNLAGGVNVSLRTKQLQDYTIGVSAPAPIADGFSPRVACFLKYNPKNNDIDGEGGVEIPCPLIPGNNLKVRCNKQKDWRLTYIAKLPGNWLCALSMDKNKKTGVVLSQSS